MDTCAVLKVGLTGGIGAGKSAVAQRMTELGAVLIDADRLAREVVAGGTDGLAEVVEAFGPGVLGADGELDRPALGARVFGDDEARRRLEKIIHPRVRARAAELAAAAPPTAIVVNDVPLLVETGQAPSYHLVVVVQADTGTRIRRLAETRGMPAEQAGARIAKQATDDQRRAVADVVLDNNTSLADLDDQVDRLWRERLRPFEENLRRNRSAPHDEVLRIADYDPSWPAQAERLIARIRPAREGPDRPHAGRPDAGPGGRAGRRPGGCGLPAPVRGVGGQRARHSGRDLAEAPARRCRSRPSGQSARTGDRLPGVAVRPGDARPPQGGAGGPGRVRGGQGRMVGPASRRRELRRGQGTVVRRRGGRGAGVGGENRLAAELTSDGV
jgi:dephospho-CoA kinase